MRKQRDEYSRQRGRKKRDERKRAREKKREREAKGVRLNCKLMRLRACEHYSHVGIYSLFTANYYLNASGRFS